VKNRRIVVTHYGGPDALQVEEADCPEPKNDEVRIRVLAAGVSLPDVMMREGIHPETPKLPFTIGWDLIGEVERIGSDVTELEPGQIVAALPIHGAYTEFICLRERELVPVPNGLDVTEAVSLVLNYVTAYQMLHRSAKVKPGQRVLVHGAAGGVGSALLQLSRVAKLETYGTCSAKDALLVRELGATPIDYTKVDFVEEIHRRTGDGVDAVFDGIGGKHIWESRNALRRGGRVIAYGLTGSLKGGRLASGRSGRRNRFGALRVFVLYIVGSMFLPGRRRVILYSVQMLKRLKPKLFREDLTALFDLLTRKKIKPLIARTFPLAQAREAHELLGSGSVTGKIVLLT
jgi:NADPH2:quinone reductase